ncbi:hypothetical protein [Arthrobacter ruber]|uniref:hypothetical protein n=1 Tax=Arthrobacter ruber TaxID=1258893 RepID=UPI000CF4DB97|nr:hypothetical protein [Arthrobacter ruber]
MSTDQFQADRREALRHQLVSLPTLQGADDPTRYRPAQTRIDRLQSTPRTSDSNHSAGQGQPRSHWGRTAVLATAAVAVGAVALGQMSLTAQSAHAAGVLRDVVATTAAYTDLQPAPGQYLLVSKRGQWQNSSDASDPSQTSTYQQIIGVYVPGDESEDWVLERDWGIAAPVPGQIDVERAPDGNFYGNPWGLLSEEEMDALPRDGRALLDWVNSRYTGGSASRDEDNFVQITDLLKIGLVPADLRAGLYDALALIPGVDASEQVNLDGVEGTAIGRTEPLRAGIRQEIIIDPATGLVIGERTVATYAVYGFGADEVTGHTAINYSVVDAAPED